VEVLIERAKERGIDPENGLAEEKKMFEDGELRHAFALNITA
jgi:hypothetical protein